MDADVKNRLDQLNYKIDLLRRDAALAYATLPITEANVTGLVADLASKVASTRTINTTAPLAGGGDLSADRTFSIDTSYFGTDLYWFGSGLDGNLSLGADTTLASGQVVRQYGNLTLNGKTLNIANGEPYMVIFVSGTLSLGGGTIKGGRVAAAATGGVGVTTPIMTGGNGGISTYSVFVFAKTITGTGTISAAGSNGESPTAPGAVADAGQQAAGTAGNNATNSIYIGGSNDRVGTTQGGQVPAGGTADAWARTEAVASKCKDLVRIIFGADGAATTASARCWGGSGGAGGACGGHSPAGNAGFGAGDGRSGGGGGSGGGSPVANGGNGGAGGTGSGNDNFGGAAGNGAGAGAGGGLTVVITQSAPSTLTVTSNGGNGGNGSANYHPSGTAVFGDGGPGAGGAGGIAALVAQPGNTATVTASGGLAGAAGGTSGAPTAAQAGGAGYALSLTR